MVRISKLRIPYHPVSILYEINFQVSVSPLFSMKSCKTIHVQNIVQNSVRLFNVHFWCQPGMLHAQQKWWLSLYHSLKRPSHEMLYQLFYSSIMPHSKKAELCSKRVSNQRRFLIAMIVFFDSTVSMFFIGF